MKKKILLMLLAASVFTVAKAEEQTVECGQTVQIEATANPGYKFIKWNDEVTDNPRTFADVKEAVELKAIFAKVYVLNITAAEGGSVVMIDGEEEKEIPANLELLEGESITVKAILDDDCQEFKGWSDGEAELTRTITASSLLTDLNIEAQFAIKKFTFKVSADDDSMGSVSFSVVSQE